MRTDITMAEFLQTTDGHMAVTFACRYAMGRSSIGSQCFMRGVARDIAPVMMAKTALVIARDIGQGFAIGPAFDDWDPPVYGQEPVAELDLYDACVARLRELGEVEGFEWRRK